MPNEIDFIPFTNSEELIKALQYMQSTARALDRHAVVYVESNGFTNGGLAILIENTLTDGSKTYDIRLSLT